MRCIKRITSVRKFTWEGSLEHFENGAGQTETQIWNGRFNTEFQRSDQVAVEVTQDVERLARPFVIAPGVTIPIGDYNFSDTQISYSFGQQRKVSGTASLQVGQFYDGHITTVSVSGARLAIAKPFSLEPSLTINRVKLPYGNFTTKGRNHDTTSRPRRTHCCDLRHALWSLTGCRAAARVVRESGGHRAP